MGSDTALTRRIAKSDTLTTEAQRVEYPYACHPSRGVPTGTPEPTGATPCSSGVSFFTGGLPLYAAIPRVAVTSGVCRKSRSVVRDSEIIGVARLTSAWTGNELDFRLLMTKFTRRGGGFFNILITRRTALRRTRPPRWRPVTAARAANPCIASKQGGRMTRRAVKTPALPS